MKYLKGSFSRTILPPGYHVEAKHDLKFLRNIRREKGKSSHSELNLYKVLFAFSVILVFLLLNSIAFKSMMLFN
jgi:hypothetical protein